MAELVQALPDQEVDELGTVSAQVSTDYRYEVHALGMASMPFMRAAQQQITYNGWGGDGTYDAALKRMLGGFHRLMQLPAPHEMDG